MSYQKITWKFLLKFEPMDYFNTNQSKKMGSSFEKYVMNVAIYFHWIVALEPLHRGAFASSLSGGFTTMAVINPPESKLAKRTSVHCELGGFLKHSVSLFGWTSRKVNNRLAGKHGFFFHHYHLCRANKEWCLNVVSRQEISFSYYLSLSLCRTLGRFENLKVQ